MIKGFAALISGFDRFTVLMEENNNLLDDAVSILTSIDKKVGQSSGSKLKISASAGSGKEFSEMFSGVGELVKILAGADSNKVDSVINSIVSGINKLNNESKDFNKNIKDFNANIVGLGMAILKFAFAAAISTPLILIGIPALLLVGGAVFLLSELFETIDVKKFKEGTQGLEHLGKGLLFLAGGLLIFKVVEAEAIIKAGLAIVIVGGAMALLSKLGGGGQEMQESAKSFLSVGAAIAAIGLGLFVFQAVNISPGTIFMAGLAVVIIGGAFAIIGKFDSQIKKGSSAINMASLSIIAIGAAMFIFQKFEVSSKAVIKAGLTVVIIGGAFAIIGKFDSKIKKGSLAIIMAGLGIIAIGFAVSIFETFYIGAKVVTKVILTVIGIGLAFGLIGKFAKPVAKGSLVMILAGVAVGIIGFSMKLFADSLATAQGSAGMGGWEFLGFVSATVAAIGIEMGLAGLAAPFILAGAASMIVAGGALFAIAEGLKAFAGVKFSKEDAFDLSVTLAGIRGAFTGTGGNNADKGFFGKIGAAFTTAASAPLMIASAAGFIAAGSALIVLSKGLKSFQSVDFGTDDASNMALALSSITTAFAQAGGEPAAPGGLFGAIFGNTFSPNATERGIDSVMDAGDALTGIAEGLVAFQSLIKSKVKFGDINAGEDGNYGGTDTLAYAIINTVGFIKQAFSAIGGKKQKVKAGGFFGSLFGIESTATEEGIRSVMDAGDALTGIAEGLVAFQSLIKSKVKFGTKDPGSDGNYGGTNTLAYAITNTLGFVGNAFASIGGMENEETALFGLISWDENKVAKGIEAVSGAGGELTNIAKGLVEFQKLVEKEVDFSAGGKLANAVNGALTMVGDAFAQIGGKENEEEDTALFGLISWDENKTAKGIDAVKGAGDELTNIAKGLEIFTKIDTTKVQPAIEIFFKSILDFFSTGADPEVPAKMEALKLFTANIVTIAENAEGLEASSKSLESIATSMGVFKTEINGIDLEKLTIMDQMFCNLQKLAEIDTGLSGLASDISASLDAGFTKLGEFLTELNSTTADSGSSITDKLKSLGSSILGASDEEKQEMMVKLDPAFAKEIQSLKNSMMGGLNVTVSNIDELQ